MPVSEVMTLYESMPQSMSKENLVSVSECEFEVQKFSRCETHCESVSELMYESDIHGPKSV